MIVRAFSLASLLLLPACGACSHASTSNASVDGGSDPTRPMSAADAAAAAATVDASVRVPFREEDAGSAFQGEVHLRLRTGPSTDEREREGVGYTILFRGSRVRWERDPKPVPPVYVLYDRGTDRIYTVTPGDKLIVATPAHPAMPTAAGEDAAASPRTWTLRDLGRKRTIAGSPCDEWEYTDSVNPKRQYGLCASEDIPSVPLEALLGAPADLIGFGPELEKRGSFPLKIFITDTPNLPMNPLLSAFAVRAEATPIDPALMNLPDYKVVEAPGPADHRAMPR
jgi:hypothetical protein